MSDAEALRLELRRKAFHLLTLVYLALYLQAGPELSARLMLVWTAAVGAAEGARLRWPGLNRLATAPYRRIMRAEEDARLSGMFWTSVGATVTMLLFSSRPEAVHAGLICLALGDAAAAVAGRAFGRRKWPGSRKSVAGSAACLLACFAALAAWGLGWPVALLAAVATAGLELAPLPFDDNAWIPVGSGALVWLALL